MSRYNQLLISIIVIVVYYTIIETMMKENINSNIMDIKVLKNVLLLSSSSNVTTINNTETIVTNSSTLPSSSSSNPIHMNENDTYHLYHASMLQPKIIRKQSCDWIASNDTTHHQPCYKLLVNHMRTSLNESYTKFISSKNVSVQHQHKRRYINRRWILLGDSTVYRLYAYTHLRSYLMDQSMKQYIQQRKQYMCSSFDNSTISIIKDTDLQCRRVVCDRCNRVQQLGTIPNAATMNNSNNYSKKRILPSIGEGPMGYGLYNASCTDCRGCDTKIISCHQRKNKNVKKKNSQSSSSTSSNECTPPTKQTSRYYTGPAYGGFITIEFSRDVEIQSQQYTTTQENIIHYFIQKEYNTPSSMIKEFGKPICIVNTGQHDIALPNITKEMYVQNMIWYLELLNNQCDYIIYISNNSPLTDQYAQTKQKIYEWNIAVRDILLSSTYNYYNHHRRSTQSSSMLLHHKSFFLDIYNASLDYLHHDNVHMATSWYVLLATFLSNVMNANLDVYEYI